MAIWTKRMTKRTTKRTTKLSTIGTIGTIGFIGLLATLSGTVNASTDRALHTPETVAAATTSTTPGSIWDAAVRGDSAALEILLSPASWDPSDLQEGLLSSIEQLKVNIDKRETTRAEQILDADTRLLEHLSAYDESKSGIALSKALAAAVELQMLFNDDDKFFSDANVSKAISISDKVAAQAELDGD